MQARGRKGQLLMDFETEYGQSPTTPAAIKLPFETCNIGASQTLNEDNTIRNDRNPAMPSRGNIDVSGSTVVPIDFITFGYWLKALFGAPETDGSVETGAYTHVFTPGDTQPSFVIERGFTDIGKYLIYNGCKVSRISIDVGGEGDQNATVDIMGAKETAGDTSYDVDPTEPTLTKFGRFQALVTVSGAAAAKITAGQINIDAALDGNQYILGGQGVRGDIPEGIIQPTGSITTLFEDLTLLNLAINGTETAITFKWTSGTNSLEIKFPEVILERTSPPIEGPQGIVLECPFRAYYENALEEAAVQVTLKNAHAGYE